MTWHLAPVLCGGFVGRPFRLDCLVSLSLYSCCETQKSATAFLCNTNRAQSDLRHRRDPSFFHPEVTFLLLSPFCILRPKIVQFSQPLSGRKVGDGPADTETDFFPFSELMSWKLTVNVEILTGAAEECFMLLEPFDALVAFRLIPTCLGPNHVSYKPMPSMLAAAGLKCIF